MDYGPVIYSLRRAATWRIVAELMRRHHDRCGLRILETHPGGGQYDCISLYSQSPGQEFPGTSLCDFNQQSQNLHIWGLYGKPQLKGSRWPKRPNELVEELNWPNGRDYVTPFLQKDQRDSGSVVDQIEQILNLPRQGSKRLPPENPAVLMIRLIATVIEGSCFGLSFYPSCGWFDSSDASGAGIQSLLKEHPAMAKELPKEDPEWPEGARIASKFWFLHGGGYSGKISNLLDLRGQIYFENNPTKPWNVWEEFNKTGGLNTGDIRSLVAKLEAGLGS